MDVIENKRNCEIRTKRRLTRWLSMNDTPHDENPRGERPQNMSDSWPLRWAVIIGSFALVIIGGIILYSMAHTGASSVKSVAAEDNVLPHMPAFPGVEEGGAASQVEPANGSGSPGSGSNGGSQSSAGSQGTPNQKQALDNAQDLQEQQIRAPYEAQMEELRAQQELLAEREKLEQQQREAVPSLLPENPPQPVTNFKTKVR